MEPTSNLFSRAKVPPLHKTIYHATLAAFEQIISLLEMLIFSKMICSKDQLFFEKREEYLGIF
jgi:hypothetical protein